MGRRGYIPFPIERLKEELGAAWTLSATLLPMEIKLLLFEHAEAGLLYLPEAGSRQEFQFWELSKVKALTESDIVTAGAVESLDGHSRVRCPLCQDTPQNNPDGWALPEGLRRHLDGTGTQQCPFMHLTRLVYGSRDVWIASGVAYHDPPPGTPASDFTTNWYAEIEKKWFATTEPVRGPNVVDFGKPAKE